MSKKPLPELSDQQIRFCEEYLIDLNATQAAIRASYSEDSARAQGSRLLADERAQEKIQMLMAARSKRVLSKADKTLREIDRIANSDIRHLFNDDWSIKPIGEWPTEAARAVASIEVAEIWEGTGRDRQVVGELKKLKLWDKTKALEMRSRHENLFAATKVDLGEETLEALLAGTWPKKEGKK